MKLDMTVLGRNHNPFILKSQIHNNKYIYFRVPIELLSILSPSKQKHDRCVKIQLKFREIRKLD